MSNHLKILVTGAAGFIGSNLCRTLVNDCGHHVLAVDSLTYAGNLASLQDLQGNAAFQFIASDIGNDVVINRAFRDFQPDAVMNLAAESHVDRSIDSPDSFIQTNIVGTYRLLQTTRSYLAKADADLKANFRFLHVSTDEVYGSLQHNDPAFTETTPYDPRSPYSASKAASDHLVRAWGETYGLPVIITNCSNNYGPYQFPEKLIPVVILKAIRGEPIPVYGTGENVRDWLFVLDHANALELVARCGKVGQTYNIGGDNEQKNIDLVNRICTVLDDLRPPRQSGLEVESYRELVTLVADRPGHDLRYAIDASKIKHELGWQPKENFASGLRKTVEWYLDNETWWQAVLSGEYRLQRQGLENPAVAS